MTVTKGDTSAGNFEYEDSDANMLMMQNNSIETDENSYNLADHLSVVSPSPITGGRSIGGKFSNAYGGKIAVTT